MVFAFDAAGDGRGHAEDDQGDEAADVREDVPAASQKTDYFHTKNQTFTNSSRHPSKLYLTSTITIN